MLHAKLHLLYSQKISREFISQRVVIQGNRPHETSDLGITRSWVTHQKIIGVSFRSELHGKNAENCAHIFSGIKFSMLSLGSRLPGTRPEFLDLALGLQDPSIKGS